MSFDCNLAIAILQMHFNIIDCAVSLPSPFTTSWWMSEKDDSWLKHSVEA